VANRRISEFSSIPGLDIDEQDLLTLVHVFEVDPVLRNKKITFTEFKNYLDLYYPSTAGGTFSGNVLINGNLTVTGTSTFTSLTSSNLGTFSGIVVQNNAIVSGTVSGNTVTGNNVQASIFNAATGTFSTVATGTTAAFTTGAFVALTGTTTQGTSATYTNGTFTNLTGTTITGTTVNATTGNFQEIVTPSLNVANLTVSGLTVTGTAIFASGVTVTGTLSGTTVTGTTAQFTNVTGVSGVFTSQVSGAVITGDTVLSTTITGVSGTFTSSVSGATVTGNTGAFSNLTGVSGVFTQRISGDTITGNTILLSNVTGVSGVFTTQVSGATLTGNTVNATFLNAISGDFGRVSGTTITGNAGQFTSATGVSGVFTTQLSGATITGNIGQFASLTGATGTFTTSISGTTVTGDTIKGTNITGIAGVFTTSVSGSTITGNTIQGTSGVFQNISGNTITGTTISAGLVQAISGAFTNIVFINTVISGDLRVLGSGYIVSGLEVSGQISGYTVTATGGNFTSLTGTTTTGTNANFATGTFQVINATTHNVSGNLTVTGALGVSGTATFATGVNVSGTLSGVTVTGSTAQFTTGTFISLTGTTAQGTTSTYTTGSFTSLTGTTTTGTTANFASGVFTTSVSGTTVIASTGTFTSLTGTTTQGTTATYTTGSFTSLTGTTTTGTTSSFTSGVFTTLSGATATFTSGIIASGTAAAPSLAILADLDTGLFSPGANQLAVATNGTGRLFIDASGRVGVGISPGNTLHVNGTSRFEDYLYGTTANGILYVNDDLSVTAGRKFYLDSGSNTYVHEVSSDVIAVVTGSNERLRITSAGLVGVGTSAPSGARVHSYAGNSEIESAVKGEIAATVYPGLSTNIGGKFLAAGFQARYGVWGEVTDTGWSDQYGGYFKAAGGTAANAYGVYAETGSADVLGNGIAYAGYLKATSIGAGGAATIYGLRVENTATGGNISYGALISTVAGPTTVIPFRVDHAGSTRFTINSSGQVGIGTTSPSGRLHVERNDAHSVAVFKQNSGSFNCDVSFEHASIVSGFIASRRANGDFWLYQTGAYPIVFHTNSTERARITSAGLVGIGSSSPNTRLEVASSISTVPAAEDFTTTVGYFNNTYNNGTNGTTAYTVLRLRRDGVGGVSYGNSVDFGLARYEAVGTNSRSRLDIRLGHGLTNTTDTTVMSLLSSGAVGIGTTSASTILHVASTAPYIRIQDTDSSTGVTAQGGFEMYDNDGDRLFYLANESSSSSDVSLFNIAGGALKFGTSGSERGQFDSSGRLLVGTSTARSNVYQSALNITPQNQIESNKGDYSGGLSLINCSASGYSALLTFGQSFTNTLGGNGLTTANQPLGIINFTGNDGTNFRTAARISAETDAATGSGDMPGRIVLATTADGASSPTERMRITNLGVLKQSTTGTYISTTARYNEFSNLNATSGDINTYFTLGAGTSDTSSVFIYCFQSGVGGKMIVYGNGNIQNTNNSYGALSDIKLKENIVDAASQWNDIKALQVRKYNFKEGQTHTQIGLVAQEVELVSPGLVSESPDRDEEGNDLGTVTKSVNYSVLYMKAVKALQEAMERIESLEAKVAALESA
jgi:collagen type VII alpha